MRRLFVLLRWNSRRVVAALVVLNVRGSQAVAYLTAIIAVHRNKYVYLEETCQEYADLEIMPNRSWTVMVAQRVLIPMFKDQPSRRQAT